MTDTDTPIPSIETDLFLTVSGPPGCGATSLCTRLSEAMDCEYVSGGDIFREVAEERDMSLTQLSAKAQESEEIDRTLDQHLRSVAEERGESDEPFILESRLAGWIAGDYADLRIYLDAPDEVRKDRIGSREETAAEMGVREVNEAGRYRSYYEIDVENREFYDLHLNTARWNPRGVFEVVRTAIEQYDPDADEGSFVTVPMEFEQ